MKGPMNQHKRMAMGKGIGQGAGTPTKAVGSKKSSDKMPSGKSGYGGKSKK